MGIFKSISIWEPYDMGPYEMWEKFVRELGFSAGRTHSCPVLGPMVALLHFFL